jgi:hypothetical protein
MNANGVPADTFMNIFQDPMFVNPEAGDFHLRPGSPCIDAGNPESPLDPDTTVCDIGAYAFLLYVTVRSPDGSEAWMVGETDTVRWFSIGFPGNVHIELNRNYPSGAWDTLAANEPNSGAFLWQVTEPATSHARVRITSIDLPEVADTSDADFNIFLPLTQVALANPASGYEAAYDEEVNYCWHPVEGATLYRIQWDDSVSFSAPEEATTLTDTCFAHTIVPSRTWFWRVRAESFRAGPWSEPDSVIVVRNLSDQWINTAGGSWFDSTNWDPPQVPGPLDTALITLPGEYTVTINGGNAHIGRLILGSGLLADTTTQTLSVNCALCSLFVHGGIVIHANGILSVGQSGYVSLSGSNILMQDSGQVALSGSANLSIGATNTLEIMSGTLDLSGNSNISNGGIVINAGVISRNGAGESTISSNYWDQDAGSDSSLLINAGTLAINAPDSAVMVSTVVIESGAELEIQSGLFKATSTITGEGALTLSSGIADVAGNFPFTGTLNVLGGAVNFHPQAWVSMGSFRIESNASFTSSVDIFASVVNMNGGTTNANLSAFNRYNWTAGSFFGPSESVFTINPGCSLFVSGTGAKNLDTRDLIIDGIASMSGSGIFSLLNGSSVATSPSCTLTIGDSFTITGAADTLYNRGQMFIQAPLDTCFINVFLWNNPAGRTPGTIDILESRVRCDRIRNDGSIHLHDQVHIWSSHDCVNNGLIDLSNGSIWTVDDTLLNMPSGNLSLFGDATISGLGTLINQGTMSREGGGLRTPANSVISTIFYNESQFDVEADTMSVVNAGANLDTIHIFSGAVLRLNSNFDEDLNGGYIWNEGQLVHTINNVTIRRDGSYVVLRWSPISGVTRYDIYAAAGPDDQYSIIGIIYPSEPLEYPTSTTQTKRFYRVIPIY